MDTHTCFLFWSKCEVGQSWCVLWSKKGFLVSFFTFQHCFVEIFDPPMPFLEVINVLDLVSLYKAKYKKKMHVHQMQDRCFFYVQMMKINCDTAQEYYLQQAIKDKMQGFSFSHPKCSATVLLQLAVELQHLKEEFYNVGKWTMLCTLAFYSV